jgi:cobalamin biosynthesis Mg chelatase CobN
MNTFRYLDLRTGKWTEEDTSFSETFSFTVDEDVPPGDYVLRAEVEYDKNRREIKRYQTITVAACSETENIKADDFEETEESVTVAPIDDIDDQEAESTSEAGDKQEETPMLFSTPFLIAAIIVALLLLFVMLFLMKKKIL